VDSTGVTEPSGAVRPPPAGGCGPAFQLLESKLRPPWSRPGLVARVALSDRLLVSEAPVVVVVAPPGYGTTTLLAQWSHLSCQEIGQRLFVPRNTVKTHAMSIYQKLGVASRSEAIARVQEIGLL
jgi:ATP/maltotriose-dependent transcriptional regulator MalT